MNKEDILNMDLKNDFYEFCDNQEDCLVCLLNRKESSEYFNDLFQDCKMIYNCLSFIQDIEKE